MDAKLEVCSPNEASLCEAQWVRALCSMAKVSAPIWEAFCSIERSFASWSIGYYRTDHEIHEFSISFATALTRDLPVGGFQPEFGGPHGPTCYRKNPEHFKAPRAIAGLEWWWLGHFWYFWLYPDCTLIVPWVVHWCLRHLGTFPPQYRNSTSRSVSGVQTPFYTSSLLEFPELCVLPVHGWTFWNCLTSQAVG